MKRILLFVLIILAFTSCNAKDTLNGNDMEQSQQEISSEGLSPPVSQSHSPEGQTSLEAISSLEDEESSSAAVFYQEYGFCMTQSLIPQSEHEKELLCRLSIAVGKFVEEAPIDDKMKNMPPRPELTTYLYNDFDNDGTFEMFATEASAAAFGIWFIDDETAVLLSKSAIFCPVEEPLVLDMQNQKFVVFKSYGDVSRTKDYMYGLRDGKPYETNISQYMIDRINQYGEVLVVQTTYDAFMDSAGDILGRTWKPYYFHVDKDGYFKEYGGIEISLDFVRSMNGAQAILKEHLPDEAEITSTYYRDNGVVNINYFLEERGGKAMYYITLRYDGIRTGLEETERGIYLDAIQPELAEYPAATLPQYK